MPIAGAEHVAFPLIWKLGDLASQVVPPQQGMIVAAIIYPAAMTNATLGVQSSPNNAGATTSPRLLWQGSATTAPADFGPVAYAPVTAADGTVLSLTVGLGKYVVQDPKAWWGVTFFQFTGGSAETGGVDRRIVIIFKPAV